MTLWSLKSWKFLAAAALASSLGGCAGGANYYAAQPGSGHPFSNNALSNDVFLDGTGQTSRRAGNSAPVSVPGSSPIPMPTPDAFDIGFTIAAAAAGIIRV